MIRKTLLAAAAFAPLALGFAPASAGVNAVAVAGTGSISPGLPCPASGCAVHLDFTAAFAGQDATGTANCTFDGIDNLPGTVQSGAGSGTISCSGGVTASGTVGFTRTVVAVSVNGSITVNGAGATVSCTLGFVPTSVNPTTTFGLAGACTVTVP